jgi:transposase-like protein
VKEVARAHNIDPAVVREWRDASRALGANAFSRNGRRRFTKEFKEVAVRRVEEGAAVKEVARACRVHPNKLRRWRDALRDLGNNAFLDSEPKTKTVIFRLTKDEHKHLKAVAKAASVRSLSAFVRSRLLDEIGQPPTGTSNKGRTNRLRRWQEALRSLGTDAYFDNKPMTKIVIFRLTVDEHKRLKTLAKAANARSLSALARCRVLYETGRSSAVTNRQKAAQVANRPPVVVSP